LLGLSDAGGGLLLPSATMNDGAVPLSSEIQQRSMEEERSAPSDDECSVGYLLLLEHSQSMNAIIDYALQATIIMQARTQCSY
jgi:hypothetical protein